MHAMMVHAGKRWGGNYTAQGKQVCQALFNFCISKDSGLTLASANSGGGHDGISRSSDWMLAHFLLFSQACCHSHRCAVAGACHSVQCDGDVYD